MNQPLNIFQPRSTATLEDLLEKSSKAREAVWQQLGSLEPLVLSHLVSPTLSGGPKWPALRQAFRLVRRPNGNVILASDGLSDPFDDITLGGFCITLFTCTFGNLVATAPKHTNPCCNQEGFTEHDVAILQYFSDPVCLTCKPSQLLLGFFAKGTLNSHVDPTKE